MTQIPSAPPAEGVIAANYGSRVGAYLIDGAIPAVLAGGSVLITPAIIAGQTSLDAMVAASATVPLIGALLGLAFSLLNMVAQGSTGQSMGKKAVGLRTVTATTLEVPGFGRVLGRYAIISAGAVVFYVGALVVMLSPLWDSRKLGRGWHDYAANTWVIDVKNGTDPVVFATPAVPADRVPERPDLVNTPPRAGIVTVGATPDLAAAPAAIPTPTPPTSPLPAHASVPPLPPVPPSRPALPLPPPYASAPPPQVPAPAVIPQPAAGPIMGVPRFGGAEPAAHAAPTSLVSGETTAAPPPRVPVAPASQVREVAHVVPAPAPAPVLAPAPRFAEAAVAAAEPQESDFDRTRMREPVAPASVDLVLDTGESFTVYGAGLIGRNPGANPGESFVHLIPIEDHTRSLSKTHAQFGFEAGTLWVTDRHSTNGTSVRHADGSVETVAPETRVTVRPGDAVLLGDRSLVVGGAR